MLHDTTIITNLLQQVLNNAPYAMVALQALRNIDGKITEFKFLLSNKKVTQSIGHDHLEGKQFSKEFPSANISGLFDICVRVTETGEPWEGELKFDEPQPENWAYVSVSKLEDGCLVSYLDITERKEAEGEILRWKEAEASKSEDKYRMLFDSIDEGFCIIQLLFDKNNNPIDYKFLEANKAFEKQTGFVNAVGRNMKELVPMHDQHWFEIYGRIALTGKAERFQNPANAMGRYYDVYAFRVDEPEERHVAVLFNDITERKKAEERKAFVLRILDSIRPLSNPLEIQDAVTRETMNYFRADRCYYCELSDKDAIIQRDAFRDGLSSIAGTYSLSSYSIFNKVLETGSPFIIHDVRTSKIVDNGLKQVCVDLDLISFVNVPVVKEGKVVGILSLVQNEPRNWASDEVELVVETAERTWAATARAQAEKQLKELNESLEKLVDERTAELVTNQQMMESQSNYIKRITDTVPDMISVIDLKTRKAEFINQATFRTQGYDPESMMTKKYEELRQLVHPDDHNLLNEYYAGFQDMSDEDVVTAEYRAKAPENKDWSWYRVRGRVFLRDEAGNPTHNLNVIQNITFQKIADEKIQELNKKLVSTNRELAYLNSELKTFNTIAATDYSDALKQVYLNLELLITHEAIKLSDSGKAHLRRAQSTVQKLKLLTADLTSYTQLKDPHSTLEEIDLKKLLESIIGDIRTRRQDLDIIFECDDLPKISGYPSLITLVFHHLLDNAVKFRKDNSVDIHISCSCSVDGYHVISISDKGIGFTADMPFEEMFTIFKRHHDKSKYKGSGIGLAICKKVMELHGGYITATGNPGEGATFNCYFPE
jgi:PAS domain S-box-containing protein